MKKISMFGGRHRASSLVVTLLVLVVLSTIVVAFLQSMSVERLTAKSQTNIYRSQLAAQAGMAAAMQQLSIATSNSPAFIVGQTNDSANLGSVLVIGQTNLTNVSQLMPLISGDLTTLAGYPAASSNNVLAYINARTNTNAANSINLNLKNALIEVTTDVNKYRASWVYLTNSDGTTNGRYAYVVLDEWARINPRYHGDGTLSRSNATNWFPGVGVLSMYTGDTNLLASTNDSIGMRAIATNTQAPPLSPLTIGQAFATRSNYDAKKHLITMDQTLSPDVIPADLPQGGRPKYNINDLATNALYGATAEARATNIANIIMTNLPNFGKRDLGLQLDNPSGQWYLNRLGANIVDYIDADSVPTTVNGGEPAGKEINPYVTMVGERDTLTAIGGASPSWTFTIKSEFFVQVWNPYTVTTSGTAELTIFNRQTVRSGTSGAAVGDFNTFNSAPISVGNVQPNEYKVINFGAVSQTFTTSVNPTVAATSPGWGDTSSSSSSLGGHPQFRMKWNGALVDMNRSDDPSGPQLADPASAGLPRNGSTLASVNAQRWTFSFLPSNIPNTVADPRITWICQSDWGSAVNNIALALWAGRQSNTAGRTEDRKSSWINRDYIPRSTGSLGTALTGTANDPTLIATAYSGSDATNAPAYIKNDVMQSIGELGHIFDPVQVNDTGGNVNDSVNHYYRPGGGYSLRIGYPEFTFANTNGKRAIELIDLFTVNSTNSVSTNYPVTQGRVNINTAPLPVLEALFLNISPRSDLSATNSVITAAKMTNFANLVISNRPYSKLSDLYKITPGFVNPANYAPAWAGVAIPPSGNNWSTNAPVFDRGLEESFGKMVGLCTVQSRAFRLYVIGEALNSRTLKREGRSVLETVISVQDVTNGVVPATLTNQVNYLRWEN